jgi:tetratricopeptide (TPR) repeat protein
MSSAVRASLHFFLLLALACSPSDPLVEIREQHETGRFEDSIGPLRGIVDRDPTHIEAVFMLGRALLRTGNAGLAVWPLRKAAETDEYAVEAGLLLTQAMLESRTSTDAIIAIDRVLALEPENIAALMLRVEANREANKMEDSLADIDRVLEIDPDNLPVLITRVTALITLDRIEEAGTAIDAAQESFDASDGSVAGTMLARLCVARALFAAEKGDTEVAETHFTDCIGRFPTDRTAVTETVRFFDSVRKTERATEILRRAAAASGNGELRTQLARRLGALGNPKEEEEILRMEAESGSSTLSWIVLADYYVQRDRFEPAIEAFASALTMSPGSSRIRFAYADTLVQAERYDEARDIASRIDQAELRSLIRGRILLGEGNPRGALQAFEAGIKLWPNNFVGRFLAGQAAEQIGNFPRAVSHYRESFRGSPGMTDAGRLLAELYAAQGLHDGALQIASRYIQAHKQDPEAFLLSIRIANALGRGKIVEEGLKRLAKMPGQAAIALAENASLLAAAGSPELAVMAVEAGTLDLTDPSNAIAFRVLIEQLGALGEHEKAAGLLDLALAAKPDASVFHELQGGALRAAGQADSANAGYQRALELDEQSWRALAGLAALAAEAGDTTLALSLYDRALEAGPEDETTALAAVALVRETDPAETARRLERLLEVHPRSAASARELAGLLAGQGEHQRAKNYAARAAWFDSPEPEPVEKAELPAVPSDELPGAAPGKADPASLDEPSE